ncbi:MAG: TlpA family protein disulfide reductase [Bdellovibrio sp.]|nr:TlpA family protein disulfide reductase [Bdellovibrio sp.]
MNAKLTGIFLVIALLCVIAVFNFNKMTSYFARNAESNVETPKEITFADMNSFLKDSKWVDYAGTPVAADGRFFDSTKTVYVHLWASWCAPCLNEIPELIAFAKKNKDRALVVLVSLDDAKDDLTKFLKSFPEMNEPLFFRIWDQEKKLSKFVDADRLPMTIVLDNRESKLRSVRSVVDWKNF